jgi:cytoskeletal protein CcmA (bactofilin family)
VVKEGNDMLGKKEDVVQITTLIGSGSNLTGDFSSPGSARIDGKVDGNVEVAGTLIVGAEGAITGNVKAETVIIGGEVLGNVDVPQKVELTATARVLGDIATMVLVIDEHAVFQGKCNMNQPEPDKKARAQRAKVIKEGRKSAKAALAEALKEVQEAENQEQQEEAMEAVPKDASQEA